MKLVDSDGSGTSLWIGQWEETITSGREELLIYNRKETAAISTICSLIGSLLPNESKNSTSLKEGNQWQAGLWDPDEENTFVCLAQSCDMLKVRPHLSTGIGLVWKAQIIYGVHLHKSWVLLQ